MRRVHSSAWRRTAPIALAASVPWALSVWWLGDGWAAAHGAVILCALLAVLLWPADDIPDTGVIAYASPARSAIARIAWLALWASLTYDSLLQANRTASGPRAACRAARSAQGNRGHKE